MINIVLGFLLFAVIPFGSLYFVKSLKKPSRLIVGPLLSTGLAYVGSTVYQYFGGNFFASSSGGDWASTYGEAIAKSVFLLIFVVIFAFSFLILISENKNR